jgi:hypothetical protein
LSPLVRAFSSREKNKKYRWLPKLRKLHKIKMVAITCATFVLVSHIAYSAYRLQHMEDDIQQLYVKQLKAQLLENTHEAIQSLIARYPDEFDLQALIPLPANSSDNDTNKSFLELYRNTLEEYRDNDIEFDIHWVNTML